MIINLIWIASTIFVYGLEIGVIALMLSAIHPVGRAILKKIVGL